jgi:glutathione synthase/RimK-type ligase-like ATP-grasp enzyme
MPEVQPDDVGLAEALVRRGWQVQAAPWNGPFAPFAAAELVVVRSAWDYHHAGASFAEWLERLERVDGTVINPPRLMRWNLDKGYLIELAQSGAPVVPTRLARPHGDAFAVAMRELGVDEAVVKPVVGASGDGLSVVCAHDAAALEAAAHALGANDALVQPLVPEIRTRGELSLTFLGGRLSHAVVKRPAAGSILVHAERGGTVQAIAPSSRAVAAAAVLAMLPDAPVYARVDLVERDEGPLLMEIELIEPELFLRHGEGAADRFADALLLAAR